MSTEITGLEGTFPKGNVAIIASRYNESICDALVTGAVETLADSGFEESSITVIRVPGAWELPVFVKKTLDQPETIAAIALGCVIKGETTHDEHINRAVSDSLMELGVSTGKPIGFGLLTCNTIEQALQRSGGNVGNKGKEAADAVVEMLRLNEKLKLS